MEIDTSTLLAVFGRFCMAVLWRDFDKNANLLVRDPGFWQAARHHAWHATTILLITDYALFGQLASWLVRWV